MCMHMSANKDLEGQKEVFENQSTNSEESVKEVREVKEVKAVKYLYLVTLKGCISITGKSLHTSYVVASTLDEAYVKVKTWLDKNDLWYSKDRALESITLLASTKYYDDASSMLFLECVTDDIRSSKI